MQEMCLDILLTGQSKVAPCPACLCVYKMVIETTAQPAGDAPLPCMKPCVLRCKHASTDEFESPKAVHKKNFICWMEDNIECTAFIGVPNAWKISEVIAGAIRS